MNKKKTGDFDQNKTVTDIKDLSDGVSTKLTSTDLSAEKLTHPERIAGMTLSELSDDYRDRIFEQYLSFWDNGGVDREFGGFICELNDDGRVKQDEKFIWYQGRGLWVYSFLYNNFGRDRRLLDIANKSREFLIKTMYLGDGNWRHAVDRRGNPVESVFGQGSTHDIYGALFSACGLLELYKATGDQADLDIAKTSIWASVKAYENPNYEGTVLPGIEQKGIRTQGHSFVIIWILTNLLSFHKDPQLEELQEEHVDHLVNHFWNEEYGIINENLFHDYTRIAGHDSVMFTGHSLEGLWMVLHEALRKNNTKLFHTIKTRIRNLVEMNWDYVFGGLATEEFLVFKSDNRCLGPNLELKVMWAHAELLIATMSIFEHTGELWAKEWYERAREYCLRTMVSNAPGIWRQAVNRFGEDQKRPNVSIYRKDNFHQVRYQMMNLLAIQRMLKKGETGYSNGK